MSKPSDDDLAAARALAIAEAALAGWRPFLDLRLEDKFEAPALLEQPLHMELALFERAQGERVN
jgi:hypothetical protein